MKTKLIAIATSATLLLSGCGLVGDRKSVV